VRIINYKSQKHGGGKKEGSGFLTSEVQREERVNMRTKGLKSVQGGEVDFHVKFHSIPGKKPKSQKRGTSGKTCT